METWYQRLFLGLNLCLLAVVASAETAPDIYQPDEERIILNEADINANDFEAGLYMGMISIQDFGTNAVIGLRLAYHISENYFLEINAAQSDIAETSFEKLTNIPVLPDDERDYTYYNIGAGYNLFQGESFFGSDHAFNSSFYLTAALGSTEFATDSYHTFSWGFGYKIVWLDWFNMNLGAKHHLFRSDIFAEKDELFNSVELHTGFNLFF